MHTGERLVIYCGCVTIFAIGCWDDSPCNPFLLVDFNHRQVAGH